MFDIGSFIVLSSMGLLTDPSVIRRQVMAASLIFSTLRASFFTDGLSFSGSDGAEGRRSLHRMT